MREMVGKGRARDAGSGGKKVERAVSGPISRLNFRPGQPVTVSHSVPPPAATSLPHCLSPALIALSPVNVTCLVP